MRATCLRMLTGMRGPDSAEDRPPDTDRIWTIPNAISMVRLAGIPFFLWLLADGRRLAAAIALIIIAGTDWVDGGLARKWNQVTTLGKVLDPTIDRALLFAAFVGAMVDRSMPIWLGAILILREVVIAIGAVVLGLKGHRRLTVTWHGKMYAFGMMAALPFFFIGNTSVFWAPIAELVAWALVIPSAVLSWITAFEYAKKATSKEALPN